MKINYTMEVPAGVPDDLREALRSGRLGIEEFVDALRERNIELYLSGKELIAEPGDGVYIEKCNCVMKYHNQ